MSLLALTIQALHAAACLFCCTHSVLVNTGFCSPEKACTDKAVLALSCVQVPHARV